MRNSHAMPFGTSLSADGMTTFQLWAPAAEEVRLVFEEGGSCSMERCADGWHRARVAGADAGSRYRFRLADGTDVPDPASRYQPLDVGGPSEVVDPLGYDWSDEAWRGRPWHEAVIYELHIGTFTEEGTFSAAAAKLDHLVALGITAIEIMPIAEFGGRSNWGYDGALLYAPESAYGRPEDLKALVDAAHARGLMVFLDVVYNHFGPEGNYLGRYAPDYFSDEHNAWGASVNLDGPNSRPVRDFIIHNALYWLEEFHFDGLRLDAVHALRDDGEEHLLAELARRVRSWAGDRHVHLIVENEENDADLLARKDGGGISLYSAQWNDDVHHVLHTAVTGEASGYYGDYAGDRTKLARALAEGFAFQGEVMRHRGSARGKPSGHLPPTAFIAFLQNHDQIGNRPLGDRITASASLDRVRAAAAVYLLLPQIPMIFMGEEWATGRPFPFFCDFGGELAEAIRKGRTEELSDLPGFERVTPAAETPDPVSDETARSAELDWEAAAIEPHRGHLDWYRRILEVRRREIVPRLPNIPEGGEASLVGSQAIAIKWKIRGEGWLRLAVNLSASLETAPIIGRRIWPQEHEGNGLLLPWSVSWAVEGTKVNEAASVTRPLMLDET